MKKYLLSLFILSTASFIFLFAGCKQCSPPPDGCPGGAEYDYEECACVEFCSPASSEIQACHDGGGDFDYELCRCNK
ncbi:MAG: hypothetical protein R3D00_22560 [Bacteroidia bacterium]